MTRPCAHRAPSRLGYHNYLKTAPRPASPHAPSIHTRPASLHTPRLLYGPPPYTPRLRLPRRPLLLSRLSTAPACRNSPPFTPGQARRPAAGQCRRDQVRPAVRATLGAGAVAAFCATAAVATPGAALNAAAVSSGAGATLSAAVAVTFAASAKPNAPAGASLARGQVPRRQYGRRSEWVQEKHDHSRRLRHNHSRLHLRGAARLRAVKPRYAEDRVRWGVTCHRREGVQGSNFDRAKGLRVWLRHVYWIE